MQCVVISIRIDCDGFDIYLVCSFDYMVGDFVLVGNQDFVEYIWWFFVCKIVVQVYWFVWWFKVFWCFEGWFGLVINVVVVIVCCVNGVICGCIDDWVNVQCFCGKCVSGSVGKFMFKI